MPLQTEPATCARRGATPCPYAPRICPTSQTTIFTTGRHAHIHANQLVDNPHHSSYTLPPSLAEILEGATEHPSTAVSQVVSLTLPSRHIESSDHSLWVHNRMLHRSNHDGSSQVGVTASLTSAHQRLLRSRRSSFLSWFLIRMTSTRTCTQCKGLSGQLCLGSRQPAGGT